ncbi:hypothetical protein D3C86_919780 [compost metagenome]
MVFLGVAHAAQRHHGGLAGVVAGFRRQVLGRIGVRAAGQAGVIQAGRLVHHQVGGFQLHPGLRQGVLDALVLADGAAEHGAFAGVLHGAVQRGPADAHGFRRDQDAFRVQTVQDVFKPAAFFADAVGHRNAQAINEQHVRVHGLAAHFLDFAHLDLFAVQIGIEQGQALGGFVHLGQRGGARQQQHLGGDLRRRYPDLAAVHHVLVTLAHRACRQLGGVQAGIGFGHGKAGLLAAGDQGFQPTAALLVGAEHHHGVQAEDVHVYSRRAGKARAGRGDSLHHQRRFGHAQARAAILRRHRNAQPAVASQVGVQWLGKAAFAVAFQPVFVGVAVADARYGVAQRQLLRGEGKVHQWFPSWVMPRATSASIRASS